MQTNAAIADGQGRFSIERIEVGSPMGDEVLVEIHAAGICHTDHASLRWQRPLVMGHEGAGRIVAIGPQVTHVQPGARVLLNWAVPCGECYQCSRGATVLCESSRPAHVLSPSSAHAHAKGTLWRGQPVDRSFNLGTLSGLALVRAPAVTEIPDSVSFRAACIVGCGVMTGYGSAINIARVQPGESVAIIGCGGVGLNVIQGARLAGASVIIAIDRNEDALARGRRFGATHAIVAKGTDPEFSDLAAVVRQLTDGRGVDHAFEATSAPTLAFVPLRLARNGGAAYQVSGCNENVMVNPQWFMWNKTYQTPLYGGCQPARDFPRIFDHYGRGQLFLDELITKTYPLEQLGQAFDDMLTGRNSKGVILFHE